MLFAMLCVATRLVPDWSKLVVWSSAPDRVPQIIALRKEEWEKGSRQNGSNQEANPIHDGRQLGRTTQYWRLLCYKHLHIEVYVIVDRGGDAQ